MRGDKIDKFVLVDRDIPHAGELFSHFTHIESYGAHEGLDRVDNLERVDILIIRSTLKVDRSVLDKMPALEFIGTTTAGRDHITQVPDKIKVASAPGCNAPAVCDYVFYALFCLDGFIKHRFQDLKFGIVGVGNVGSRVWRRAGDFGFRTVLVDPPRMRRVRKFRGSHFQALYDCDIVSVHVPLNSGVEHATVNMIGEEFFEKIKPKTILINTSRGGVVDEQALLKHRRRLGGLILDVYRDEPVPCAELIETADIATPHIAGHSHQAFYRGALMAARYCYRHFKRPDLALELDKVEALYHKVEYRLPPLTHDPMDEFKEILKIPFDIHRASELTKKQANTFDAESFAQLRRKLRRDENRFIILTSDPAHNHPAPHLLTNMGFKLKSA